MEISFIFVQLREMIWQTYR